MCLSTKYCIIKKKTQAFSLQWYIMFGKNLLPSTIPKKHILNYCLTFIFFSNKAKNSWKEKLFSFFPIIPYYRITIMFSKKEQSISSIILTKKDLSQLLKRYIIIEKIYYSMYAHLFHKKKINFKNFTANIMFNFFFKDNQVPISKSKQISFFENNNIKTMQNVCLRNYVLRRTRQMKKAAGVLFIDINQSNTFCYYSDWKGNILVQVSTGMLGFKNSNKSSQIATLITVQKCMSKINSLIEFRREAIHLRLKGMGSKVFTALESIMQEKKKY